MRLRWRALLFVVPLPLWLPVGLLVAIGTQGAKSGSEAQHALAADLAVTLLLLALAVFGVYRYRQPPASDPDATRR